MPIAGYGLALFLGEGSVDGGDELTAHIDSIDTFTLESDIDTQLFQFTDILEAVLGVAGESRDGLNKDLVDQAAAAIRHHPLEVIPLGHRSSCDSLVRIDVNHAPFGLTRDQLRVVAVLGRKGIELILGV